MPPSVHMMCLTTTATKSLREEVMTILGLRNPEVIAVSPSKLNITFMIKKYDRIQEAFSCLVSGLLKQREQFP